MKLPEYLPWDNAAVCTVRYRPVKLYHPVAGFTYGLYGEWRDASGRKVGELLLPDVSCDYLFVSRLAVKCTAALLDPEQLHDLLDRFWL